MTIIRCLLHDTHIHFNIIQLDSFVEYEMFQAKGGVEIETHFMFNNVFPKNRAFYEIIWGEKNMLQPDEQQMDNMRQCRNDTICMLDTKARVQKHTRNI